MQISQEKVVTEQEVLAEANAIWKKVTALMRSKVSPLTTDDTARCDELLKKMQQEHPEFAKAYPIVLRYMCQMLSYQTRALKHYLLKLKTTSWKSETDYLDSQAEYVVLLYKENHRGWKPTEITQYRDSVRKMLQHEHTEFKDRLTKYVDEFESKDAAYKAEELAELKQFYAKNQEYLSNTDQIPVTVQADAALLDTREVLDLAAFAIDSADVPQKSAATLLL